MDAHGGNRVEGHLDRLVSISLANRDVPHWTGRQPVGFEGGARGASVDGHRGCRLGRGTGGDRRMDGTVPEGVEAE